MPRFTMDFDTKFDQNLTNLQEKTGASSKAEVIRYAVALYKYLKEELPSDNGTQKLTITKDGEITNLILP